jgi:hypothetical protein
LIIWMSAPATKQPGFAEMRTAELMLGLFSISSRTPANSSCIATEMVFIELPGWSIRTTATPSITSIEK